MRKIKEIILDIFRKPFLKDLNKIGVCTVKENDITCLVKSSKIVPSVDELNSEIRIYNLLLNGINKKYSEELLEVFELDKPIYYVFENIKFDKTLIINACGNNIIFRNCQFTDNIIINNASNVVFKNNKYLSFSDSFYLTTEKIESIKFVNETFSSDNINVELYIRGKNITLINTTINNGNFMLLDTNNLELNRSCLNFKNIDIYSKNILSTDSTLNTSKVISIKTKSDEGILENIKSDFIIFNDKYIINEENILKEKKIKLLNTLKSIKDKCNDHIKDTVKEMVEKEKAKTLLKD